jgi:Xaa-Pro dipeptidase
VTEERCLRVVAAIAEAGADWALLTSAAAVRYSTGFAERLGGGPAQASSSSASCALVDSGGSALLVTEPADAAAELYPGVAVRGYRGPEGAAAAVDEYVAAVAAAAESMGLGGVVAIEPASCPGSLLAGLQPSGQRDITPALARQRATKTSDERAQLRWCAVLTGVGQQAAAAGAERGVTELELFSRVRVAMERAEGSRITIAGDLVSGRDRTAAVGGFPSDRAIGEGDPVICDLVPRSRGYWGDSCTTLLVGAVDPRLEAMHAAVVRALSHAAELLQPGLRARVLDGEVRRVLQGAGLRYPHHTGHGVGTEPQELPLIVPESTDTLEAGMVVAIEPGAYNPELGGVRLEWLFEITDTGSTLLSPYPVN